MINSNISLLKSNKSITSEDGSNIILTSDTSRQVYLSQEYLDKESVDSTLLDLRGILNQRYYDKLGTLHYLVKLGYNDTQLLELSPVELLVKQYKIKEIEDEINKRQEDLFNANSQPKQ